MIEKIERRNIIFYSNKESQIKLGNCLSWEGGMFEFKHVQCDCPICGRKISQQKINNVLCTKDEKNEGSGFCSKYGEYQHSGCEYFLIHQNNRYVNLSEIPLSEMKIHG